MCICINFKWVDRCITYHDVEDNHGVDHICDLPDFKAKKPFIHVNIVKDNNGDYKTDWDVNLVKVLKMNLVNGLSVIQVCNYLLKGNK